VLTVPEIRIYIAGEPASEEAGGIALEDISLDTLGAWIWGAVFVWLAVLWFKDEGEKAEKRRLRARARARAGRPNLPDHVVAWCETFEKKRFRRSSVANPALAKAADSGLLDVNISARWGVRNRWVATPLLYCLWDKSGSYKVGISSSGKRLEHWHREKRKTWVFFVSAAHLPVPETTVRELETRLLQKLKSLDLMKLDLPAGFDGRTEHVKGNTDPDLICGIAVELLAQIQAERNAATSQALLIPEGSSQPRIGGVTQHQDGTFSANWQETKQGRKQNNSRHGFRRHAEAVAYLNQIAATRPATKRTPGSVRPSAVPGEWVAIYEDGYGPDGKRRRRSKSQFPSAEAAQAFIDRQISGQRNVGE